MHVLIHEYADHKAAITRIYRGLCSTFKFETYGDLTVEIMEACQTLNAVEHMSLCPLEMFAPGSGYSKGSSKRPGSGSFQPPNPTVGISGGTLQENGSTCFYLDKEDQGEDSDGEFEVVGAQDNHINGVRENGTNARSSGNAMERLFSKLRNFGHRAKRYCLSREELFMVFGYVYLLGITHAHWSRDRAITAAGRSLHQLTAYYCLHALCAADESSNSEVVRQYLCLLCEMGWTSIALGVAEDYSSKDPSDAVTKHLLSLHRCELNLKKNDEDEIRSNSNLAELPRLKGFDYSLFVPLLNLKFRLGHLPYVHLMTALNYMLTYFENNSECVGGLKGNLLSYVHDIGRLVIHHCIPYVKHGAALRIGVNSDSRSGIYSFDSVPCNDFSILRHIVSILHEAALTNTHSPIGSSSSTGVHKFNVDNKKNGTATSKMELINRNYNSMYVPVNSLTATANSKKALPQLKITSTNVADAVTWYKHHYTDNHCNYNGAFNYSVLDADEGIVTPHYNKQLTIEFLCRLIHLHLVRSAGENGMDGFEDGKILLQEAWNLIYSNTVDDFSSIPHYRQSTNQIKHLNEEDQVDGESLSAAYVSNVQRSIISEGNVHRDADVADRGQANASVVTSTAALNLQLLLRSNEFERIEMLRQIPTLFGWRVVEGSGMNYHSRWGTHIQADLLYYCGRYIYDSNRRYGREMSNNSLGEVEYEQKAREMYMLALSMHNHHIPSLIAIIELDLQLLTHTNNHVNDLSNDSYKNIVCTKTSEADCAVNDCDSPNSTCIVLKDKIHVLLQSVVECICCNDQTLNSKMDQLYRNSASVGNRKDAQAPYTHPFGFQVYYLYGQYYEFCKLTNEAVHCYGLALQYQQNEQNHKNLYNYCNILLGKN